MTNCAAVGAGIGYGPSDTRTVGCELPAGHPGLHVGTEAYDLGRDVHVVRWETPPATPPTQAQVAAYDATEPRVTLGASCPASEAAAIRALANKRGVTVSAFLRDVALAAVQAAVADEDDDTRDQILAEAAP